jgi:hypothetical protein
MNPVESTLKMLLTRSRVCRHGHKYLYLLERRPDFFSSSRLVIKPELIRTLERPTKAKVVTSGQEPQTKPQTKFRQNSRARKEASTTLQLKSRKTKENDPFLRAHQRLIRFVETGYPGDCEL